jgi:hypothetical protein
MISFRRIALVALLSAPTVVQAQQWTPVGKTRDSTAIFFKPSSITRAGDTVTVLVLARYAPSNVIAEGRDTVRAVTMWSTFDCSKEKVKTTETVKFSNFDRNRVVTRSKPKLPGYQVVFGGTMPLVYPHVCPKKK